MSDIKPGKTFTTTVTSSSNLFKATCGGAAVALIVRSLGENQYELEVDGADVTCPGPLVIQNFTGGLWVTIGTWTVAPCP